MARFGGFLAPLDGYGGLLNGFIIPGTAMVNVKGKNMTRQQSKFVMEVVKVVRPGYNNNTTISQKVIKTSHVIFKAMNVGVGFPYCTRHGTSSFSNCLRSSVSPMLIHYPPSCDTPTRREFALSLPGRSHDVENIQRSLLEDWNSSIEAYFPPKPAKVSC